MNLYEIKEKYKELLAMLEDADIGDDEIGEYMKNTDADEDFDETAEQYAMMIAELDGDISVIQSQIKRLDERMTIFENRKNRMREALKNAMIETGKKKIATSLFTISVQKNGGKQAMDVFKTVDELPEEFHIKQPDKINTNAVRAYIEANGKENEEGDIVSDYGTIYHRGESLRIK